MKINDPILTAATLGERIGAKLIGDGTISITGLNEIHQVEPGDLCFVDHPKYYDKTLASAASVILIDREYECPPGKALLVTEAPFQMFDQLVREYRQRRKHQPAAASNFDTCVALSIGKNTIIENGVSLGDYVTIGDNCHLHANVTIGDGTIIGDGVTVQSGSVIGSEAFYFKRTADGYQPWVSGGHVVLEDNVEVGPGCTIARGVSSPTVIGKGSKLDAQVQIGHDCKIGQHCLLAAQVGIAGNTKVEDWCILQGQVGLIQNLTIGPRAVIMAQSGVTKDLEGDQSYFGSPAQVARKAFQDIATVRRLRNKSKD